MTLTMLQSLQIIPNRQRSCWSMTVAIRLYNQLRWRSHLQQRSCSSQSTNFRASADQIRCTKNPSPWIHQSICLTRNLHLFRRVGSGLLYRSQVNGSRRLPAFPLRLIMKRRMRYQLWRSRTPSGSYLEWIELIQRRRRLPLTESKIQRQPWSKSNRPLPRLFPQSIRTSRIVPPRQLEFGNPPPTNLRLRANYPERRFLL